MMKIRNVALVAYDGFQLLDITGPAVVFAGASRMLARGGYAVDVLSPNGGLVASDSGVRLETRALAHYRASSIDTLLVAGAEGPSLREVIALPSVRRTLPKLAARSRRFGSVCSGTFVLAALDLIGGRKVATHWEACATLAARYPDLDVDPAALYVVDGCIWTSAGVTTGIDMALALVEVDLGAATANLIARHFVLYARRPGYQSQFSPLLQAQTAAEAPFAGLIDWMQGHLDQPLDGPSHARRAGLTERSFYRKFTDATGKTPAHFVEGLRLDAARTLLAQGLPLKAIAGQVGLTSSARLGAAFERRFGMAPSLFREMHRAA